MGLLRGPDAEKPPPRLSTLEDELSSMQTCVGKTYGEIWQIYSAKHGDTRETREIHRKWRRLAAEVWRYGR
jgi:hypothetical protein